ncbi:hypothetical protein FRC19_002076 [Serendipita sp. 401]|nr:hypothetical protein FRC19_002076 [Serendipita sp. 401]KAG9055144.1 hypothetical protein FS842_003041 [Serendipita sp. 407]
MSSYKVIVRERTFTLSKEQILFDSPNYFSTYFLGGFSEAAEGAKQLTLQRHPALFELVYEYLNGYDVLPIPESYIPSMAPITTLRNLHKDALFYGLDELTTSLEKEIERVNSGTGDEVEGTYTLVVRDRNRRLFPKFYPISKSALPEYLEHFRKGNLLLQDREWLFPRYQDKVFVSWYTSDHSYAILKGYSEGDNDTGEQTVQERMPSTTTNTSATTTSTNTNTVANTLVIHQQATPNFPFSTPSHYSPAWA